MQISHNLPSNVDTNTQESWGLDHGDENQEILTPSRIVRVDQKGNSERKLLDPLDDHIVPNPIWWVGGHIFNDRPLFPHDCALQLCSPSSGHSGGFKSGCEFRRSSRDRNVSIAESTLEET